MDIRVEVLYVISSQTKLQNPKWTPSLTQKGREHYFEFISKCKFQHLSPSRITVFLRWGKLNGVY